MNFFLHLVKTYKYKGLILLIFLLLLTVSAVSAQTPYDTSPYPNGTGWFDEFSTDSTGYWVPDNASWMWNTTTHTMNQTSGSGTNKQIVSKYTMGAGTYTWNMDWAGATADNSWREALMFGQQSVDTGSPVTTGNKYLLYIFNTSGSMYVKLYVVQAGASTIIGSATYNADLHDGLKHNYTIEWNSSNTTTIIVYDNGTQVMSSTNTTYSSGYAGIGIVTACDLLKFDNVSFAFKPAPNAYFTSNATTGTGSAAIAFTDGSNTTRYGYNSAPTTWAWNFTDVTGNNTPITFSTSQNPTYTFGSGNFSIVLNSSNAQGFNLSTQKTFINISASGGTPVVTADFTSNVTSGINGTVVQFADASDAVSASAWNWYFGDGNTSTLQNPLFKYNVSGTFTVNHSVTNASGTNWSNKTAYITIVPSAKWLSPSDLSPYPDGSGWFDGFGDDDLAQYYYGNTSSFSIITPANGGYLNATATTAKIFMANKTFGTGLYTWNVWRDPSISDSSWTISLMFAANGIDGGSPVTAGSAYRILLENGSTNNDISIRRTTNGTSTTLTIADYLFDDNEVSNISVDFNSSNATSIIVYLNGTEILSSTDKNFTSGYAGVGAGSSPKGVGILNMSFTMTPAPRAAFDPSLTTGDAPLVVSFSDESPDTRHGYNAAPTAWNWTAYCQDNATSIILSTSQNPVITFGAGNYSITLNVSNANGFNISSGQSINVTAGGGAPPYAPNATNFTSNVTTGIAPTAVQFNDTSSITNATSWYWDFGDGNTSTDKNATYTYVTAGTYTVNHSVTVITGSGAPVDLNTTIGSNDSVVVTGNPLGGGAGYSYIIYDDNPDIIAIVDTAQELISNISNATSGDIIYIPETANINLSISNANVFDTAIPANVTIASNRGENGSLGGRIYQSHLMNDPSWSTRKVFFTTGGENVRITGLRLEGPFTTELHSNASTGIDQRGGIKITKGWAEVDNCELSGFSYGAISTRGLTDVSEYSYIHHNYIHHCRCNGYGIGVDATGPASTLIEANIFDYCRHDVSGSGYASESYEMRYNFIGDYALSHPIDLHHVDTSPYHAGDWFLVHHNTITHAVDSGGGYHGGVVIRGPPDSSFYLYNNWFTVERAENILEYTPNGTINPAYEHVVATNNTLGSIFHASGHVTVDTIPSGDAPTGWDNTAVTARHAELAPFRAYPASGTSVTTWENKTAYITISSTPADFTSNVTSGIIPVAVQFNDTSNVLSPTGWWWDFGDNTNATTQNTTHTYAAVGSYTVKHNVTNASGQYWVNKSAYITTMPVAVHSDIRPFENSPYPSGSGWFDTFSYASQPYYSGNVSNFTWDTADSALIASNLSGSQMFYTNNTIGAGMYVWNVYVDSNISDASWAIHPLFGSDINTGGSSSITGKKYRINFVNTSTRYIQLRLVFGNGTSIDIGDNVYYFNASPEERDNVTVVWNASNTTSIILYLNGTEIISSTDKYITSAGYAGIGVSSSAIGIKFDNVSFAFKPAPIADFSIDTGVAPHTATMHDESVSTLYGYDCAPTAWNWTAYVLGNGSTIILNTTSQNPTYTFDAGNFTIRLNASNANGWNLSEQWLNITNTPPVTPPNSVNFSANVTSGSAPLSVMFNDTSTIPNVTSWYWNFGDGNTSTSMNASHVYAFAGTFSVNHSATVGTPLWAGDLNSTYGANDSVGITGNPLGGGAGYTFMITNADPNVIACVSTKAALLSALSGASSGDIVWVNGSANIDMSNTYETVIPTGVILASDRGQSGSAGGRLYWTDQHAGSSGTVINALKTGGAGVRVTGLRIDGAYPENTTGWNRYAGLRTYYANLEVDNCEIYDWDYAAIGLYNTESAYIHHNRIHNNWEDGLGYGIILDSSTDTLVEANIFYANRHCIAGSSDQIISYEARYNYIGPPGIAGGHNFDMHASTGQWAGDWANIHHNTFATGIYRAIAIRAAPVTGVWIDHNAFPYSTSSQYNVQENVHDEADIPSPDHLVLRNNTYIGVLQATSNPWWHGVSSVGITTDPPLGTRPAWMVPPRAYPDAGSPVTTWENKTAYITVTSATTYPPLIVNFTSNVTSGDAPLSVRFNDTSNSTNLSISGWCWDVDGDGTFDYVVSYTSRNISHVYAAPGTYTVRLRVNNSIDTNWSNKTNYITVTSPPAAPVASFSANVTSGFVPLAVQFTDASTGATAWYWEFGDLDTDTVQNPSHTYASAGTYTVRMRATGPGGFDWENKTNYITVNNVPVAGNYSCWTYSMYTVNSENVTVDFTDTSSGSPSAYYWDFGDNITTLTENPSHTYYVHTRYIQKNFTVSHRVTIGGSVYWDNRTITVRKSSMMSGPNARPMNTSLNYTVESGFASEFIPAWTNNTSPPQMNFTKVGTASVDMWANATNNWVFIIIFMVILGMIWFQGGDLALVGIASIIVGTLAAPLFPKETYPYINLIYALIIAVILWKSVADRGD